MLSSKEIRQSFIEFFLKHGHTMVPSSPVVPLDDPTLLFTNAGMNQFKDIFLGMRNAPVKRAVNSQKCIRAGGKHNDLEEVGKDGYHHTFFEMLGNWSFGDYYKKEAIIWAWELLTELWQLPKARLYATVHDSDAEAFNLWKDCTDIEPSHISYHGDKDNFWEMGETGPCGPCSEINIDRGDGFCDKQDVPGHICGPNAGCSRFIEIWNLVFIQYNRETDHSLTPLTHKYVDTGAGFERIVQVLQDKRSNYETDLFMPIITKIAELSGVPYAPEHGVSHRVIADHVRCLCFALADGGFPSNEGRGYVMRRILRRAARHGRLLGFAEPFMFHLVDKVIAIMGHHYPELKGKEAYVKMVIRSEEERFNQTLDKGLEKLEDICTSLRDKTISGKDAFTLYDTFGFPLDLTIILAEEKGLSLDTSEFEFEMKAQRERARSSSKFVYQTDESEWISVSAVSPTVFLGYTATEVSALVQRYRFSDDGKFHLQLDQTPFYAEAGGQVGDSGKIFSSGFKMVVSNVVKVGDYYDHIGTLVSGTPGPESVTAEIDVTRRLDIARNHTATHVLHKVLRSVIGTHVQQKGSLVVPEHLRFDFTHVKGLSKDEITQIEEQVNAAILNNMIVSTAVKPIAEARAEGAMALFGEKYSEQVRVVSVEGFSQELCGGTHVQATGEIGVLKIISESSSAAGIRRIEAITGRAVLNYILAVETGNERLANLLHVPHQMLENKVQALLEQNQALMAQINQLETNQTYTVADKLLANIQDTEGIKLLAAQVQIGTEKLREMGDYLKDKATDAVTVLFSVTDDKMSFLCVIGKEVQSKFNAGKIIKQIAQNLGGKGGGRADSAMGGSDLPANLDDLIKQLPELIKQTI